MKVQTLFCFELSFLLKTGFKLISICFKLTSAMVINILKVWWAKINKRCYVAGECDTLAWMGWMQEKNMIIRKSAEAFIYFSSSPVRLLLEVGALSIKCSKTLNFSKSVAARIAFRFKRCQSYSGGAVWLSAFFSAVLCQKVSGLCHRVCVRV